MERVDSTNDEARRRVLAGAPHLTVIQASEQTSGHGRRGRTWVSRPGNLYVSFILRPQCAVATAGQVSFLVALALADALYEVSDGLLRATCKWPNDLLLNGRKVSGILLESTATAQGNVDWLIAGVGVNLAHAPTGTDFPATCLADEGAGQVTPERLLEALCQQLLVRWTAWESHGFQSLRKDWLARAHGRGEILTVRLARETLRGRFVDLDEQGALVLDSGQGQRHINAGDVFFD